MKNILDQLDELKEHLDKFTSYCKQEIRKLAQENHRLEKENKSLRLEKGRYCQISYFDGCYDVSIDGEWTFSRISPEEVIKMLGKYGVIDYKS